VALVVSGSPGVIASVFTTNALTAAPVQWSQSLAAQAPWRRQARAILYNSGNANACTGPAGMQATRRCVQGVAAALDIAPQAVWVASTGIIGVPLPTAGLCAAIPKLACDLRRGVQAARAAACAIMTTDTCHKMAHATVDIGGQRYILGGMAKGAGMIHPNMATLLACITCDAPLQHAQAQRLLRGAVTRSFNTLSVDHDTSTNDCAFFFCNGAAGGQVPPHSAAEAALAAGLEKLCIQLAEAIAQDGEGATCLIRCTVHGARSAVQAALIARSIVASPLVKCAVTGQDPNWGRIVAAAGAAGVALQLHHLELDIENVAILRAGTPVQAPATARRARAAMSKNPLHLRLRVGKGPGQAVARGCNLTHAYVTLNAEYPT
jgi:glutamate N-acetyltransferase/amino-acid N-acetyltransferase